jgi:hypothetical protein
MNNINEIKLMLPDYINGRLDETDSEIVKNAISQSEELAILYQDMKRAGEFITSVDFPQPGDMYWSGLLPEIHRRIEKEKTKPAKRTGNVLSFPYYAYSAAAVILLIICLWQWNNIYKFILPDKPVIISEADTVKNQTDNHNIIRQVTDSIPGTVEHVRDNKTASVEIRGKTSPEPLTETNGEILYDEEDFDLLNGHTEEDIFEELNSLSPEEEMKLLETINNI